MTGVSRAAQLRDEDWAQAHQLYESGLTLAEVGAAVGRSYTVVSRMLRARGVELRAYTPSNKRRPDLRMRLLSRAIIIPATGCWEWSGCKDQWGYGLIKDNGRQQRVHRVAFEMWFGKIGDGLEVDHLCFVRNCLNPDHLDAVPGHVNNLRSNGFAAINARKTHCDNGHEFTPANTGLRPDGGRRCRECARLDHLAWRADNLELARTRDREASRRRRQAQKSLSESAGEVA